MRRFLVATLLGVSASASVSAEGLHTVSPLLGYSCMQLAISADQITNAAVGVPIRTTPSKSAAVVSFAASVVIAQDVPVTSTGFLHVLRPDGQEGWIEAAYLRPWHSDYDPTAKCVPSTMSNGKPGFGFRH